LPFFHLKILLFGGIIFGVVIYYFFVGCSGFLGEILLLVRFGIYFLKLVFGDIFFFRIMNCSGVIDGRK